uniref:Tetratricopeptide repeat protein n=1 Tax=Fervidobacterium pennivorans TaxID=93466 RepID=A0A7V4KCI4_FERPE
MLFLFTAFTFVFLTVLYHPAIVFGLTLEEILEKSKTDPDFAWDMYLSYISQLSPNVSTSESKKIEQVGRILNAKRKLKMLDFAIKEDVEGLIRFLKTSSIQSTMKYHILEIFGEENLVEYLDKNLSHNLEVLLLTNIFTVDVKHYAESVLDVISRDAKAKEKFLDIILKRLEKKDMFVNAMFEKMYQRYSSAEKEIRTSILELYKDFKTYGYTDTRFENILNKTSKTWYKFWHSFMEISSYLSRFADNFVFLTVALAIVTMLVLFSISFVRYKIFYILGLKKFAALTYRKIVDKDPLNEDKRLTLAQLYEEAGMFEEAMNEYNFLKRIKLE